MVDVMINVAIGIAAAVFTGLVLLFFEYRTGWFAAKLQITNANSLGRYRRLTPFEARQWLALVVPIWFLMLILGGAGMAVFYLLSDGPSTLLDNPDGEHIVSATIQETFTRSFYDNSIYITLNELTPTGTITFTIGSPGVESKVFSNVPNGYSFLYEFGSNYYDVRVTSVSTSSERRHHKADLVIMRLPP
jgi:hypothetical protein